MRQPSVITDNETEEAVGKIKPPEAGAAFTAVEEVILRRRSVRFYSERPVPEYLVRRVLEAGGLRPLRETRSPGSSS